MQNASTNNLSNRKYLKPDSDKSIKIYDLLAQKKAERSLQKIKTVEIDEGGIVFIKASEQEKFIALTTNIIDCAVGILQFKTGTVYIHKLRTSSAADIKYSLHFLFESNSLKLEDLEKIFLFGGHHNWQYLVSETDKIKYTKGSIEGYTNLNDLSEVVKEKLKKRKEEHYKCEPGMISLRSTLFKPVNLSQDVGMTLTDENGEKTKYTIEDVNIAERNIGGQNVRILLKSIISAFVGNLKVEDRMLKKKYTVEHLEKIEKIFFDIEPGDNVCVDLEKVTFNTVKIPKDYKFDYVCSRLDKNILEVDEDMFKKIRIEFSEEEDLKNTDFSMKVGVFGFSKSKPKIQSQPIKHHKDEKPKKEIFKIIKAPQLTKKLKSQKTL